MLSIVGIFAGSKVLVLFWDMIILANSFGVCYILLVIIFIFILLLLFFFKSWLGPSPCRRQNSEYPPRYAGTLIGAFSCNIPQEN